ncbi:MAG TPA: hypothetical protein VJ044_17835, partial [Candidatus Hodarchaeales archaeon]|nr:hypothetical protein [Candidatus Hodarchaeales archaeon]
MSFFLGEIAPLFTSLVPKLIKEGLVLAETETLKLIRDRRRMCVDYYQGEVLAKDGGEDDYLKNYFRVWNGELNEYEMPDGVILEHVPITKQLIDLKARVYLEQPERKVTGKKAPTGSNGQDKKPVKAEKYTDLLKRSGWFSTSKRIEQYTQLLGNMACGVFLDENTKLLQFLPILEHYPVFAEDDEIQIYPVGIFYPSALRTASGEQVWIYYDEDKKVKYSNEGNKIGEEP